MVQTFDAPLSVPMVRRIDRMPINTTPWVSTRLLDALFIGVVASLTQGLPVLLGPEQRLIPPMRDNMINNLGCRHPPDSPTLGAHRM